MSMPPAQPAHAEERPPKRTKIRLACQECRDRKIRCDGGRPTCNACARKKLGPEHCIYIEPHNEVAPSYVRSLESRIRELEERPDRDRGFIRKRIPQAQTGVPFSTPHSQTPTQQDHAQMKDPKGYPCSSPLRRYDGERSLPSIHNVLGSDYPSHLNHRQQSAPLNAQNGPNTESPFPGAYASPEPPYRSDSFNVEQRRNASPLHGQTGSLSAFQPDLGGIIHEQKSRAAADNPEIEDTLPNSHSDEALEAQRASAMGATAGTPPSATVTGSVFLGPSSAAAFMKEVQKTSSVWKRTHSDFVGDGVASSTASRASRPRSRKEKELVRTLMEELVLPPRRVADAHLNNYWKHVYPLYPILHKPSFMKRYESVWNHDPECSESQETVHSLRAFFSTFNTILALGSRYSTRTDSSQGSNLSAETFFQRSQQLTTHESPDHGSLQLVQALILTAQYLQGSDMVNRCWVTVGLAIRVAQGIGIQLDYACESQAEREERRRTWWCCILMDRVLSMTFGRPPMVVWPSLVPFPAIVDDEELSMERSSSSTPLQEQHNSKIAFFIHALELSNTLIDVLKNFYTPRRTPRPAPSEGLHSEDCRPLLDLDDSLERWSGQLPEHLRYREDAPLDELGTIFRQQAVVLHCRYLHLRILLFRPIAVDLAQSHYFDPDSDSRHTVLKHAIAAGCIRSCVSAAQELIHTLFREYDRGHLPVSWYSVFYLYTAGTVILAVLVTPTLRRAEKDNFASLEMSWAECIECLSRFADTEGGFAKRCLWMLQSASSQILSDAQANRHGLNNLQANGQTTPTPNPNTQSGNGARTDVVAESVFGHYDNIFAENGFGEPWWPIGSLEWLSNIPTDFNDHPPPPLDLSGYYGNDAPG